MEELVSVDSLSVSGRGELTAARLDEHLRATVKRLIALGLHPGGRVASVLPAGPDTATAKRAVGLIARTEFVSLDPHIDGYESLLLEIGPQLLLIHPGKHPAREAARRLGIPVANVLRHFEAGVFTLEAAIPLPQPDETSTSAPMWKRQLRSVPLVLIAPGLTYRRLANRLNACCTVIGITPPTLEHLPPPHTIEHIAAECVRMLRRYRPQGPYALAGWQSDGVVALEMARMLEEAGEKIPFVAMLDAAELFHKRANFFRFWRKRKAPSCEFMAEALRQYRPRPWYGKIVDIRSDDPARESAWFEWTQIAPHGHASYEAHQGDQSMAEILASHLTDKL